MKASIVSIAATVIISELSKFLALLGSTQKITAFRNAKGDEFAIERTLAVPSIWSTVQPRTGASGVLSCKYYTAQMPRNSNLNEKNCPKLCGPRIDAGKRGMPAFYIKFATPLDATKFVLSS